MSIPASTSDDPSPDPANTLAASGGVRRALSPHADLCDSPPTSRKEIAETQLQVLADLQFR